MSRRFRAVVVVLLAIWMVPGIASFAVGIHLLVEHHDHNGVNHHDQIALEDGHDHAPAASADQLHDILPVRRVAEAGPFVPAAIVAGVSIVRSDSRARAAAELPPRLVPPPESLLHILCTLLI